MFLNTGWVRSVWYRIAFMYILVSRWNSMLWLLNSPVMFSLCLVKCTLCISTWIYSLLIVFFRLSLYWLFYVSFFFGVNEISMLISCHYTFWICLFLVSAVFLLCILKLPYKFRMVVSFLWIESFIVRYYLSVALIFLKLLLLIFLYWSSAFFRLLFVWYIFLLLLFRISLF